MTQGTVSLFFASAEEEFKERYHCFFTSAEEEFKERYLCFFTSVEEEFKERYFCFFASAEDEFKERFLAKRWFFTSAGCEPPKVAGDDDCPSDVPSLLEDSDGQALAPEATASQPAEGFFRFLLNLQQNCFRLSPILSVQRQT